MAITPPASPAAAAPAPAAAPPATRRLLLLIADTGGGHRAAASAVASELGERTGGALEPVIVDAFGSGASPAAGRIAALYSPIIVHAPWLWGFTYLLANSPRRVRALRSTVLRLAHGGILDLVRSLDPTAIVSFHPLLNHLTSTVLAELGRPDIPLVTVITDLVDVHAAWTNPSSTALVAPTDTALEHCLGAGIPADRCLDLGLPVDRSFARGRPAGDELAALRRRLGLPAAGPVLLVSGGGEGSGGIWPRVAALAHSRLDATIVVICGRNRRLRRRLVSLRARTGARLRVEGFVENMADWMRASDLLVTKAGPGAIAEALCCELPLLLTAYVPGQERGNVGWVTSHGVGRYAPRTAELVANVGELLEPPGLELEAMRAAARRWARPHAAARIAELVERLASRA